MLREHVIMRMSHLAFAVLCGLGGCDWMYSHDDIASANTERRISDGHGGVHGTRQF